MSIINRFLAVVTEPQFKLARDLTAMAIADGQITPEEKEAYPRSLIQIIGADEYSAPQEIFLFQVIAGRMGLNQMDVTALFLNTATHHYFKGDAGAKVLHSFLKNVIDPKGKDEKDNRDNIFAIYETIAKNTERLSDEEADQESLRQNLARATETFMENQILIKEFQSMELDFVSMLKEEELRAFMKYC